jgi:hypothetical protein
MPKFTPSLRIDTSVYMPTPLNLNQQEKGAYHCRDGGPSLDRLERNLNPRTNGALIRSRRNVEPLKLICRHYRIAGLVIPTKTREARFKEVMINLTERIPVFPEDARVIAIVKFQGEEILSLASNLDLLVGVLL